MRTRSRVLEKKQNAPSLGAQSTEVDVSEVSDDVASHRNTRVAPIIRLWSKRGFLSACHHSRPTRHCHRGHRQPQPRVSAIKAAMTMLGASEYPAVYQVFPASFCYIVSVSRR